MSTQFTPGPWWASATREVFNARHRTVCRAHLDGNKCSREEALANAHLIAAAPELYEALSEAKGLADMAVMSDDRDGAPSDDQQILIALRDKINAALAKARGESGQ